MQGGQTSLGLLYSCIAFQKAYGRQEFFQTARTALNPKAKVLSNNPTVKPAAQTIPQLYFGFRGSALNAKFEGSQVVYYQVGTLA